MTLRNIIPMFLLCALIASCASSRTYIARPNPIGGVNIYGVDGGKLAGTWAFTVDDTVKTAARTMKASSYACSLHIYQIEAGASLSSSVEKTVDQLFQNVLPRSTLPTKEAATTEQLSGAVVVKLDEFNPKFSCSVGQHEGYCTANTDISMTAMLVFFDSGETRYVHASGNRSSDGGGGSMGSMCSGVSNVINDSVEKTTRDVLAHL